MWRAESLRAPPIGGADLQREEDHVVRGAVLRLAVDGTWPVTHWFDLVRSTSSASHMAVKYLI